MNTELLYYTDPRLTHFQARVLERRLEGERLSVVLDRTAFYPEGGGQPADQGRIDGLPVRDVQRKGGTILHYLDGSTSQSEVAEGKVIEGTIDWERRFDYMQQHTGQHIVSASLIEAAGYPTVSAYLGDRYTAVEIDTEQIGEDEIEAAESLANQRVTRNLSVRTLWINPEEAERYSLRKPPPEVERLRIVKIEQVDAVACAGIHVASTGEVGLIKYDGLEKIRGRLRLHWLIGQRAYSDSREKDRLISAMNRELTCGTQDILSSVQDLRNKLREREQRIAHLENTLAEQRAQSLVERADTRGGIRLVSGSISKEESSFVQTVYQKLLDQPHTVACLLHHRGGNLQWRVGCSRDLYLPWKAILPGLFPLIGAKGGGRDRSWQGMGTKPEGGERFLEALRVTIWESLSGGTHG
jgi:alanyl-tRNA synthetase